MKTKVYYFFLLAILIASCEKSDPVVNNKVSEATTFSDKPFLFCTELHSNVNDKNSKGALLTRTKWANGQTIHIKFMDGDAYAKQKIREYAQQWLNYANVKFDWLPDTASNLSSDIRITFAYGGFASELGTDCLVSNRNLPTMFFQGFTETYLRNNSQYADLINGVVLHEFGHALGLIHEQSQPLANISWNYEAVYSYYFNTNGWSRETVDSNVFYKYPVAETNFTAYDPTSIMHYAIPAGLTTNGFVVEFNKILSNSDKSLIGQIYPIPAIKSILNPGEILYPNQFITSPNGQYTLIMQTDGNLVIYRTGGIPIWSSNTATGINSFCVMQTDGNLVIYDYGGNYYWASNTGGMNGSILVMQDDGNLVTYLNGIAKWSWMSGRVY